MHLNQKIIRPKIGLLELAKSLGSISSACKAMGYSRDSYYRIKYAELNLPIPEASLRGIDGKFSFGPFCFDYNNRGKPRGIYPKEI